MARKVSVSLEADTAGFIGPVDAAAHATEKLDDKVDSLDRSLNKIPLDSAKAGAALKLLNGDVKDVGTNFQAVGDKSTAMTVLDSRIRNTRSEVKKLSEEFVKTGDVDIFHKLSKASGDLGALTKIRKDLSNAVDSGLKDGVEKGGPEAAKTFSQLFEGGVISALKNPAVLAAAVGLAAALAIPIGAIIGGAILGGAGVGAAGLAGFAALLADSEGRIKAAAKDLLSTVTQQVASGGAAAIGPMLAGIRQLKLGLEDVHLDRIIASAAKFIEPLAAGASRFATYLGQGVQDLIDKAGPAVKVLAEELPAIGRAVKSFFDSIASGGAGGARALQDFLHWIEAVIITTGQIIGYLEKAYGAIRSFGDGFENFLAKARDANPILNALLAPTAALLDFWDTGKQTAQGYAHSLSSVSKESAALAAEAKKTAESIQEIDSAFKNLGQSTAGALTNKILDSMFALDEATLHFQESLNSVTDAAKANGRALQGNSEKALKNKEALLAAAEANASLYAQNLLSGDSAAVAGKKYEANAATLRKQAIAAGFNATEVDKLIGKYGDVPLKVQTILATKGLTEALNNLAQILIDFRTLNGADFKTKYTITTIHQTQFTTSGQRLSGSSRLGGGQALGGIRHAALGMIVAPSDPGTLIGEPQTGGELNLPLQGITQARAMSLMQVAGAGYGLDVIRRGGGAGGTMRFEHTFTVRGNADSGLATWFMRAVRRGDIQISSQAVTD
jgi:hypothetical protein